MKRCIGRVACLVLILGLTLAGCGKKGDEPAGLPDDPLEALEQVSQKNSEVQSAHITMMFTFDMSLGEEHEKGWMGSITDFQTVDATGRSNMRNRLVTSLKGQEMSMEHIILEGEMWVRVGEQDWLHGSSSEIPFDLTAPLDSVSTVAVQYLEGAKDVQRLADEVFKGVDCYKYSFDVDIKAMTSEDVLNQFTGEQAWVVRSFETAELKSQVWIDKEILLLRRQVIMANYHVEGMGESSDETLRFGALIDYQYTRINEPIEIQAPLE